MTTGAADQAASGLRRELAEAAEERTNPRCRFPRELRQRVVEDALERRAGGETLKDIADDLGMVESTLARWVRWHEQGKGSTSTSPRLLPVAVSEPCAEAGPQPPGGLRLITPAGYVVEGLDLGSLCRVLKVIG